MLAEAGRLCNAEEADGRGEEAAWICLCPSENPSKSEPAVSTLGVPTAGYSAEFLSTVLFSTCIPLRSLSNC